MAHDDPSTATIHVHFGAEHTTFAAPYAETLAALKAIALTNLRVVQDPAIDYFLQFEGETISNEAQTLGQLFGEHVRKSATFHVIKRPKGGASA